MANPTSFPGDIVVSGNVRLSGTISPVQARASVLAITELVQFTIPWHWWRIWNDAANDNLPGTAAADDLALIPGTFGTASPSIQGQDCGNNNTTAYARVQIPLPWDYADGNTVTLRFHAGMLTTVAQTSVMLDVLCYETDEEVGISADICNTVAQSINSVTLADIDFTITPTALVAGDLLDVRITIVTVDVTDAGVMTPVIGAVKMLYDAR